MRMRRLPQPREVLLPYAFAEKDERKTCPKCSERKPRAEFYVNRGHRDGLSGWCKICTKADRHRAWREKHPEPPPYVPPTEKACAKCGIVKPMDQFHLQSARRDKRQTRCIPCANAATVEHHKRDPEGHNRRVRDYYRKYPERRADAHLRWRLGVEPGTYDRMFAEQGGVCAICGTDKAGGNGKRLSVDHNDDTGEVRGLLCTSCNNGLGRFAHDVVRLSNAIDYLKKYGSGKSSAI